MRRERASSSIPEAAPPPCETAGRRAGVSRRTAGQHLSEYALVMGVVALAAISVQYVARRAIQGGVQSASDTVLGRPLERRPGCPDTDDPPDGLCDCDDADWDGNCDALDVRATSDVREAGAAGGRRTTQLDDTVRGQAQGQFVREITVPTGHVFRTGSQAPPEPEAPEPDDELPEILLP